MTESEWNSCADPQKMLEFLRHKVSERKSRLFAVACCRSIWPVLTDDRSKRAVEIAELYADQQIGAEARQSAHVEALAVCAVLHEDDHTVFAARACEQALDEPASEMSEYVAFNTGFSRYLPGHAESWDIESGQQCNLLRDIFGNPFKPVTINRSWLTSTVVSLAQAIYDDRAFDRLPVLADALEESGCTSSEMLEHGRGENVHVRGCWVVDLLLGKN